MDRITTAGSPLKYTLEPNVSAPARAAARKTPNKQLLRKRSSALT
jgi:hypothetical protein